MKTKNELMQFLSQDRNLEMPHITLYMPTHRAHPDNQRDPITYKNFIREIEKQLEENETYPRRLWQAAVDKLKSLYNDDEFWPYTSEGMAVLAAGEDMKVFKLFHAPQERVHIGPEFFLIPLLAKLQHEETAHLVDLSHDRFEAYLVSRSSMVPVQFDGVITSFSDLFTDLDPNANLNVGSYSGLVGTHHGHRTKPEETEKNREKYFRYLDDEFSAVYKEDGIHMILSGTTENLAQFRAIAKGNFYTEEMISQPVSSLKEQDLINRVLDILSPLKNAEQQKVVNRVIQARREGNLETDLGRMLDQAQQGRVGELILNINQPEDRLAHLNKLIARLNSTGAPVTVFRDYPSELQSDVIALNRY